MTDRTLLDKIEAVGERIHTIDMLIQVGAIVRLSKSQLKFSDAVVDTVTDTPDYQVGTARYPKRGDSTQEHYHENSVEFLIQIKGQCGVFFEDGAYRVLMVGDIAKIEKNSKHRCIALADNSEQLWICIPAEEGYKIENLKRTLISGLDHDV